MALNRFLLLAAALVAAQAKKQWGLCPSVDSNIKNKEFNVTKMMGIWYEYLTTPELKEGFGHDCSSWLMLQDNHNDSAVFQVLQNRLNSGTNDSSVRSFTMDCSPTQYYSNTAVCYYQPEPPKNYLEHLTSHKEKSFRIIYTDYFAYTIVSVC